MVNYGYSKLGITLRVAAVALAISPLGCGSTDNDDVAAQTAALDATRGDDGDTAEASRNGVSREETLRVRADNQRREDEAAKNWVGDAARQAELARLLRERLPERIPAFATQSARTRLAEMDGPEILRVLGYTTDVPSAREGDKSIIDDGITRLRTSSSVAGYFKFADRAALFDAHQKVGTVTPVGTERIERQVAQTLDELGVPAAEVHRIRARPVVLDTIGPNNEIKEYGAAAFISNVHRQVRELPVIGSECSLAFDIEGALTWGRCRWPQFRLSPSVMGAAERDYDEIVRDMARQLDRTLDPLVGASSVDLSTSFAYEERVTSTGVEYVPVLRAILLSKDQAGAELTTPVYEPSQTSSIAK